MIDEDLLNVLLGSVLVAVVAALAGAYLTATIVPTEFGELPSAPLDEIELTPGSLLLFESNVEINLVLGTHWSHVALVLDGDGGEPVCVDLTPTSRTVQMQPAREYIAQELRDGKHRVAIRQLCGRPNPTRALRRFFTRKSVCSAVYEHSYWKPAFHRITRLLDVPPVRRGSYFCSNIIADALRAAGVLALGEEEARNILPPDFAAARLPTMPDYAYDPMLLVRIRKRRRPEAARKPPTPPPPSLPTLHDVNHPREEAHAAHGADQVQDEKGEDARAHDVGLRHALGGDEGDHGDTRQKRPAAVEEQRRGRGRREAAAHGERGADEPSAEVRLEEEHHADPREERTRDEQHALVPIQPSLGERDRGTAEGAAEGAAEGTECADPDGYVASRGGRGGAPEESTEGVGGRRPSSSSSSSRPSSDCVVDDGEEARGDIGGDGSNGRVGTDRRRTENVEAAAGPAAPADDADGRRRRRQEGGVDGDRSAAVVAVAAAADVEGRG